MGINILFCYTEWILILPNYYQEPDNYNVTNRCFCSVTPFGRIGTSKFLTYNEIMFLSLANWHTTDSLRTGATLCHSLEESVVSKTIPLIKLMYIICIYQ